MRRGDTRGPALTQAPAEEEDRGHLRMQAGPEASSPGVPQGPQLRPSRLRSRLRLTAASRPTGRSPSASLTRFLRQGGPCPPPGRPAPSPRQPPHSPAYRVLTATPGRARPPRRGRAARDAPRGRSGRPRGGDRGGRVRSRTPRLSVRSPARWATLRMLGRSR